MRKLLVIALALLPALAMTACHKHTRIIEQGQDGLNGQNGEDGLNGRDGRDGLNGENGIDGKDGLSGIGFDYVRGMDGALVRNAVLAVPAQFVLPSTILNFAPAEDPYDPDGLTLTFGTQELAFRVYLGTMYRGEYCVVETVRGEGWVPVGDELIFTEQGFIALVPLDTFMLFDVSFQAELLANGSWVEFGPREVIVDDMVTLEPVDLMLDYDRRRLSIGNDIRINFCRD
jgi:hypothetical protein